MSTTYTLTRPSYVVSESERTYVLTIHDLPLEERPRERLIAEGPAALSTTELVAILLGTGTIKEGVLERASRITREYGERMLLEERDAGRLAREVGLPIGKAVQVVAAGELGRRFFHKNTAESPVIRTARDVYEHVRDMRALPKEHLRGLYLNTRYKVIRDEMLSIGTIDANIIHPREVFRPALEYAAAAVVLVHNHPSGDTTASDADCKVTEELIQAGKLLGIELVDHVIVTEDGYASVPASYRP